MSQQEYVIGEQVGQCLLATERADIFLFQRLPDDNGKARYMEISSKQEVDVYYRFKDDKIIFVDKDKEKSEIVVEKFEAGYTVVSEEQLVSLYSLEFTWQNIPIAWTSEVAQAQGKAITALKNQRVKYRPSPPPERLETMVDEKIIYVLSTALDELVSACLDEKGSPVAPSKAAIAKARSMLPAKYKNTFVKKV